MIEKIKEWIFGILEKMAKKNCDAGRHCFHQYTNFKSCCWCRKVIPD